MPQRPLTELRPVIKNDRIRFVCPACCDEEVRGHYVFIPFRNGTPMHDGGPVWQLGDTGESPETITLSPSINCALPGSGCTFHGWVKNGVVSW